MRSSGFTLVELAIVMTIIGLLIGGILKGQELMNGARLSATIAQVNSYRAAAISFRDTYGALPGDVRGAENNLPGCTAACATGPQGGNSIIGPATWGSGAAFGPINHTPATLPSGTVTNPSRENVLFWMHLLLSGYISGVTSEGLTATAASWGVTHPPSRLRGGFMIGYADGIAAFPGDPGPTRLAGHYLVMIGAEARDWPTPSRGYQPGSAKDAAFIDRKMDDGRPSSGQVRAYGTTVTCFTDATALAYNEGVAGNDCGLAFSL